MKPEIKRFLEYLKLFPRDLGIMSHANADPDALASSVVTRSIVEKVTGYRPSIIFPGGISKVSRGVLSCAKVNIDFYEGISGDVKALVIVDTATLSQFGPLHEDVKEFKGKVFLIDHHLPNAELMRLCYGSIVREEVATSVIVYEISKEIGVELSTAELFLILSGILFDTRRFMIASPTALRVASEIVESGVSYAAVVDSLQQEMDISERIARLKAAKRAKLYRFNDWIVAVTSVSSFEASAARALMNLGADVVFVASEKDNRVRISARCTRSFYEKTGISVGYQVLRKVAEVLGGSGGGHHLAGGATVLAGSEVALEKCLEFLSDVVGLSLKHIRTD